MNEVILHLDKGHPIDIHCDGEPTRPVSAFLLLANVPADPPGAVLLTFGNLSFIGNLLMTFYQRSVNEHPEMAWVIEQVARGIVAFSDNARKDWPTDANAGNA